MTDFATDLAALPRMGAPVIGLLSGSVLFGGPGGTLAQSGGFTWGTAAGQGLRLSPGVAVTDVNTLKLEQTWNNAGIAFTAIKLDVTNTASQPTYTEHLVDLRVGGASKLKIYADGGIYTTRGLLADGPIGQGGGANEANTFRGSVLSYGKTAPTTDPIFYGKREGGASTGDLLRLDTDNSATLGFGIDKLGTPKLNRTITAAGTTGAQTINKPAGTVNFAAGAAALVVTNSLVTADSIILLTMRGNGANAVIKSVVAAAGSFTINLTANAAAETSIGFVVTN